ncbi:MAG: hypothetical protein ACLTDS_04290 [Bianqueaceae bacterium]
MRESANRVPLTSVGSSVMESGAFRFLDALHQHTVERLPMS